MIKENDFINLIKDKYCVTGFNGSVYGIGDDCAVIDDKVITCDILVENTHFNLDFISPYNLGCKSALVNISDIISMGAKPKYAFISVGYSEEMGDLLNDIYKGLYETFNKFGALILGGDTVRSEKLVINVTLIGETKNPVFRSGAKFSEGIIISNYAGLSHAGLDALFKYGNKAYELYPNLVNSHINPKLSVDLGLELNTLVSSMMDLSDGICKDLKTLCEESNVGCEINLEAFEISQDLKDFCRKENKDISEYLLDNFEDYSLLITCPTNNLELVLNTIRKYGFTPSLIGHTTESKDIKLLKETEFIDLPTGWEHFK